MHLLETHQSTSLSLVLCDSGRMFPPPYPLLLALAVLIGRSPLPSPAMDRIIQDQERRIQLIKEEFSHVYGKVFTGG